MLSLVSQVLNGECYSRWYICPYHAKPNKGPDSFYLENFTNFNKTAKKIVVCVVYSTAQAQRRTRSHESICS